MKSLALISAGVSLVFISASASLINFQSGGVPTTYLQADGVTSLSDASSPTGTYLFALGTFDETALLGSIDAWYTAFADQMEGTNAWRSSDATPAFLQNRFQNEVLMADGSAASQSAYIFGYNSDQSEIIIFRNASWVFPSYDILDTNADIFSLTDANTEVITSAGTWTSYSSNITMLAVPEPSSFALLSGIFGLACVMLRRRTS